MNCLAEARPVIAPVSLVPRELQSAVLQLREGPLTRTGARGACRALVPDRSVLRRRADPCPTAAGGAQGRAVPGEVLSRRSIRAVVKGRINMGSPPLPDSADMPSPVPLPRGYGAVASSPAATKRDFTSPPPSSALAAHMSRGIAFIAASTRIQFGFFSPAGADRNQSPSTAPRQRRRRRAAW